MSSYVKILTFHSIYFLYQLLDNVHCGRGGKCGKWALHQHIFLLHNSTTYLMFDWNLSFLSIYCQPIWIWWLGNCVKLVKEPVHSQKSCNNSKSLEFRFTIYYVPHCTSRSFMNYLVHILFSFYCQIKSL